MVREMRRKMKKLGERRGTSVRMGLQRIFLICVTFVGNIDFIKVIKYSFIEEYVQDVQIIEIFLIEVEKNKEYCTWGDDANVVIPDNLTPGINDISELKCS
ncbi:hypothetical protein DVH24_015522 [Malus domestica]|uniref:Uncharacterized protein n=1 Tax=Malus domestica TaxID=3750 RepID=A0A498HJL4_MALDO|nr:hypothetical protein DVH24_015522 [Malus domestica]